MGKRYISGDTCRCAGIIGETEDDICARRDACLRYIGLQQHLEDDDATGQITMHMGLCADGQDWMIGGEA